MKAKSPWKNKRIHATHVTQYSQKNCIPDSTFPHHYNGLLCRENISGWWQIWMLFTHGHAAQDHQGGVCRRAAHHHSAATPALQSTGAWRTDTLLSLPVASQLSLWQSLKRLFEYLISIVIGKKKKNPKQNQAKLKLLVIHQAILNSRTTVVIKWNWEVWYHTEMLGSTSWSCEQFWRSYCKKSCYTEQGSSAHRC